MNEVVDQAVERLHEAFERTDLDIEGRKIQCKIEEAKYNPGDIQPLVDCIFAVLLAARSQGFRADAVMKGLEKTARESLDKHWKKMPDGTYQAL